MKRIPLVILAFIWAMAIGCGSSDNSSSSPNSKYSCNVQGNCMKCPNGDEADKCGMGQANQCTATDASYCNP